MIKLWQLKEISSGKPLNEPQELPENWGPIFGLKNITEKLSDLSWLGEQYKDIGWFHVDEIPEPLTSTKAEIELALVKKLLSESDWSVLSDVPMTVGERALWIEYRQALRNVRLQPGFPDDIKWPKQP